MKLPEVFKKRFGIVLKHTIGIVGMGWGAFSAGCISLLWAILHAAGVSELQWPIGVSYLFFSVSPFGIGLWLYRKGTIEKKLLDIRLLKAEIYRLAEKTNGVLYPHHLASSRKIEIEQATELLNLLSAEDPGKVRLELDFDSGEIYYTFPSLQEELYRRETASKRQKENRLHSRAVDIAKALEIATKTFQQYTKQKTKGEGPKSDSLKKDVEQIQKSIRKLFDSI